MKIRLIRISVILCLLAIVLVGGWWIWRSFYSNDALTTAVRKGDLVQVNQLLSWGAQVNGRNLLDTTVLHIAAAKGNAKMTQCLIEAGADVNAFDEAGATPLDEAEIFGWVARVGEEMARATPLLGHDGPFGPAILGGSVLDNTDYEKVIKILKDSGATRTTKSPNISSPQCSAKAESPSTPKAADDVGKMTKPEAVAPEPDSPATGK